MNDDRNKLLHDVLLEGVDEHKDLLREQCISSLGRKQEKQRIHGLVVGRLRTKRRVRRFVRVAISAAALIALGSFLYMMVRPAPQEPTIVETPPKPTKPSDNVRQTPPPQQQWWVKTAEPIAKAKTYPKIEIRNSDEYRISIARDRSPYRDKLFAKQSRSRIPRITQLSRFAMTKYIRGHAEIDVNTKTGLRFKDPRTEQLFFDEGIPVRWLSTRLSHLPRNPAFPLKKDGDPPFNRID